MTKQKKTLLAINLTIIGTVLALIIIEQWTGFFEELSTLVLTILVIITVLLSLRSLKINYKKKGGLPADDELSLQVKYKSGYYAYFATMFIWYVLFLLNYKFHDAETILGIGIILSALTAIIAQIIIKRKPNE